MKKRQKESYLIPYTGKHEPREANEKDKRDKHEAQKEWNQNVMENKTRKQTSQRMLG